MTDPSFQLHLKNHDEVNYPQIRIDLGESWSAIIIEGCKIPEEHRDQGWLHRKEYKHSALVTSCAPS